MDTGNEQREHIKGGTCWCKPLDFFSCEHTGVTIWIHDFGQGPFTPAVAAQLVALAMAGRFTTEE